jgi:phage-related protein
VQNIGRTLSWVTAAKKEFQKFPARVQAQFFDALDIAADGKKAASAKPLKGLGPGIMEIAVPHDGNAFRVVYALCIDDELWIVHAFQKKSTSGIKTPRHEVELVLQRVKQLKGTPR